MGYWGYYVVARSDRPLKGLDALDGVRDELALLEERAGGWQVWECPGGGGEGEQAPDVGSMNALAAETGSPALFAYVMDSRCAVVEAAAPHSGAWTSCLGRAAMAEYIGGDERALEDYFLPPEDAAERAVAWAAEGGRTVEAQPLHDVLRARAEPSAEELFFRFLDRLGVVAM
ncbi:hypothetical protein [Streptomyces sp. VRA16 Mangrove soil]|uniref:hypothetical protein n=1 Tax=Streptomyces sp. VRA16 Mangrove soil TaxID=2817434 RepID=UPI001A9F985D|nr:hypothetical protein [Streptomyces sp. VRA16 Mangrove soil]MBO1334849.1 hypothetical protein [Streptomyces sp. VRA16 Mangrove soil]